MAALEFVELSERVRIPLATPNEKPACHGRAFLSLLLHFGVFIVRRTVIIFFRFSVFGTFFLFLGDFFLIFNERIKLVVDHAKKYVLACLPWVDK